MTRRGWRARRTGQRDWPEGLAREDGSGGQIAGAQGPVRARDRVSRQTTAEAGRLLGVQVLRFVAAALVLGHNAVLFAAAFAPTFKANLDTGLETGLDTRLETGPMVADVVTAIIAGAAHWSHMGTAGVHIFFVISGCVMALTAHEAFGRPGAARAFPVAPGDPDLSHLLADGPALPGGADRHGQLCAEPGRDPGRRPAAARARGRHHRARLDAGL